MRKSRQASGARQKRCCRHRCYAGSRRWGGASSDACFVEAPVDCGALDLEPGGDPLDGGVACIEEPLGLVGLVVVEFRASSSGLAAGADDCNAVAGIGDGQD